MKSIAPVGSVIPPNRIGPMSSAGMNTWAPNSCALTSDSSQSVNCEIHHPRARHLSRREIGDCHGSTVGCVVASFGIQVSYVVLHVPAHLLPSPTEDGAVEGLRILQTATLQLVPGERTRRVEKFGAVMVARLPQPHDPTGWISDHRHSPLGHDVHPRHDHGATCHFSGLHDIVDTLNDDVRVPQ